MGDTGFKCPKCGQTEYFTAFSVVLTGKTFIHPDGWNYFDAPNDVELAPDSMMRCEGCEYTAVHDEFEIPPQKYVVEHPAEDYMEFSTYEEAKAYYDSLELKDGEFAYLFREVWRNGYLFDDGIDYKEV